MKKIKMSFPELEENLNKLVQFVVVFGAVYNPTNKDIQLANLQTFLAACLDALDEVGAMLAPYKQAVDDRENEYKDLSKLTTRLINAFRASGASANEIADAQTYARKIQGKRKTAKPKDDPNTPEDESKEAHSASQMDFASRRQMLVDFIAYLVAAAFNPNETDLKSAALTAVADNLEARNLAVDATFAPLSSSRVSRNNLLLDAETGILNRAQMVKAYVKSVFGADSQEYSQIKGLRFT